MCNLTKQRQGVEQFDVTELVLSGTLCNLTTQRQAVEQFDVTELVLSETYHKEDLSEVSGQFDIPVLVRLKAVRDDDLTAYFTCNKQTQCLFIRILFCLVACQQNTLYTQQWRIQDF